MVQRRGGVGDGDRLDRHCCHLHFVVDGDGVGESVDGNPREHVYLVAGRRVASTGARWGN